MHLVEAWSGRRGASVTGLTITRGGSAPLDGGACGTRSRGAGGGPSPRRRACSAPESAVPDPGGFLALLDTDVQLQPSKARRVDPGSMPDGFFDSQTKERRRGPETAELPTDTSKTLRQWHGSSGTRGSRRRRTCWRRAGRPGGSCSVTPVRPGRRPRGHGLRPPRARPPTAAFARASCRGRRGLAGLTCAYRLRSRRASWPRFTRRPTGSVGGAGRSAATSPRPDRRARRRADRPGPHASSASSPRSSGCDSTTCVRRAQRHRAVVLLRRRRRTRTRRRRAT